MHSRCSLASFLSLALLLAAPACILKPVVKPVGKVGKWSWSAIAKPPLFRHGKKYFIPVWPPLLPEGTAKKTVRVTVKATRLLNGEPVSGLYYDSIPVQAAAEEEVLKAYRESQLFSEVVAGATPAELNAEVTVTVISDWGFYTNSSRYTGGLVPGGAEEIYRVQTKLTDGAGKPLGDYSSEERPTYVRTPRFQSFTDPFEFDVLSTASVGKKIIFDLNREILYSVFSDHAVYPLPPKVETAPESAPAPVTP